MEQSPSKANSHSANQRISSLFLEPEGSLPYTQEPAIGPVS